MQLNDDENRNAAYLRCRDIGVSPIDREREKILNRERFGLHSCQQTPLSHSLSVKLFRVSEIYTTLAKKSKIVNKLLYNN